MKKFCAAVIICLFAAEAHAQVPYMEEVRALGAVAGQGMACGALKYDTFEMLARAILVTKAPSDRLQSDGMYAYNEAKANAYVSKQMDGFYNCSDINRRFDQQAIFDMKLFGDGTIQMPDGKIFTPRTPYDATMVYKQNNKIAENAKAIYDGGNRKAEGFEIRSEGVEGVQTSRNLAPVPHLPEIEPTKVFEVEPMPSAQPQPSSNEPTIKRIKSSYK